MKVFKKISILILFFSTLILCGCVTDISDSISSLKDSITGDKDPNFDDDYNVGPKINDELLAMNEDQPIEQQNIVSKKLTIIIPSFDPGLEKNVKKNTTVVEGRSGTTSSTSVSRNKDGEVFPELRRVEARRFALKLKNSLEATNLVGAVRVTPDATASGEIYILGKINESDGTEVSIDIKVVDVSGRLLLDREFSHDVEEDHFINYRTKNTDAYGPVFDKAAEKIAAILEKMNQRTTSKLVSISDLRFASEFSPESFSTYLTKKDGKFNLTGLPSDQDPMWQRVKAIKVREQFFIDTIQVHYEKFDSGVKRSYLLWQRQTFEEKKAEREARIKQMGRNVLGILAIGVAIAGASQGDGDLTAEVWTATLGAKLLEDAAKYGAQANMHKSSVVELGQSIEAEMAPSVVSFEERTVELQGNATQQFVQWRSFLKSIFELERTPEKQLK